MGKVQVYGIPETIKELELLPGKLVYEARREMRVAAEPIKSSIEAYIPDSAPIRGMRHSGRTGWNSSAIKVSVRTRFTKRAQRNEESLVSIVVGGKKGTVGAAGLQIADMAGRRGKHKQGYSRDYIRNGVKTKHRLNGQGKSLVDTLNATYASPSRYVWRAAMLHMGTVQTGVLKALDKVSKDVNKNLVVKE